MALDYDKLKKERISGTKIAPFHMITAVTQRSINSQLKKMHKVNPTLQKLKLNSTDPEDDYSGLEADLDPPTIELRLGTESKKYCSDVFYYGRLIIFVRPHCHLLFQYQTRDVEIFEDKRQAGPVSHSYFWMASTTIS